MVPLFHFIDKIVVFKYSLLHFVNETLPFIRLRTLPATSCGLMPGIPGGPGGPGGPTR